MWPNPQEIAEKLYKKKQMFLVSLAIVKLKMNFETLNFLSLFFCIYIKMGKKEPFLERMDTFERKQHYNAPCAISCPGILY